MFLKTESLEKQALSAKTVLHNAAAYLYWLFSFLLWELTLHFLSFGELTGYSWYVLPFSAVAALCVTLVLGTLPRRLQKVLTVLLTVLFFVFYGAQLVFCKIFGSFFSVSQMQFGGDAITSFWEETLLTIEECWWQLLLLLLPVAVHILRARLLPESFFRRSWLRSGIALGCVVLLWAGTVLSLRLGGTGYFTVFDFYHSSATQTQQSVECFGALTTLRLEAQHLLFPSEEEETLELLDIPLDTFEPISLEPVEETLPVETAAPTEPTEPRDPNEPTEPTGPTEPPLDTSPNVLDIDFAALDELTNKKEIKELNHYFSVSGGTKKHEYSGIFKGYNLIEICAESYSPLLIDPDLTPALYKLSTEGFVFNNYYTSFQNTTTDCEYALCMGLFPDMSRDKYNASFLYSSENYVPFCLGNSFKRLGYHTLAFHNYVGSYFSRNKSHPNMGYTCYFCNDGMKFTTEWPSSDLEMMEQSLDYVFTAGEPFCAYYMTFSGHYRYDFYSNPMCIRNKDAVKNLDYPEAVRAYIACNLELEYALEYLLEQLEEKGMLDHTVIVLTGDHYPYGLSEWQYNQLAGEELEKPFGKMKNSFICWAPNMEDPVECDNYCCNIDILPTLLNLFGVDYDSRLLAGTDVLADGQHIAILSNQSFITNVMSFNSTSNKVTYFVDEDTVPKNYLKSMIQLVKTKMLISSRILYNDYYDFVFNKGGFSLMRSESTQTDNTDKTE